MRMNYVAMLALAERYVALLEANGAVIQRANLESHFNLPEDRLVLLSHARWQVEMVRRLIDSVGGETTAIRLLGSTQGLLIATGLVTVAEVWGENKSWLPRTSIRAFDSAMAELAQRGDLQGKPPIDTVLLGESPECAKP